MSVEITGTVEIVGKVKDYGHETNFGRTWESIPKFFMKLKSDEHGKILAMVECEAEETNWGLRIPKDARRFRPLIGDTVEITTHRLKENGNNDKWASVTFNQTYKITKVNKKARKEREAWIAEKKLENENKYKKEQEAFKQKIIDDKLEELGHLETQKHDYRLPEPVQDEMTKTFNTEMVINVLRDTTWFKPMQEGEGGKQCYHIPPCGCGYPGTGMRRPGGCLHGLPENMRKNILEKALSNGLIEVVDNDHYRTTELGLSILFKLDRCTECGGFKELYKVESYYTYNVSGTTLKSAGWVWKCNHEYTEITDRPQCGSSNTGTFYKKGKTPKSITALLEKEVI